MDTESAQQYPRPEPTAAPGSASPAPRSRHWWVWLVLLVLIGVGGYAWATRSGTGSGNPQAKTGDPRAAAAARGVPVVVAIAKTGDLPIYLTGLGTVTPFKTVTVRSRIDGQLTKVAFKEGQVVHEGEVLAEVDSRPFAAQLKQAQGQLAKDEALLKNAKADLERYRSAATIFTSQQVDTQAAVVAQNEGAVLTDQGQVDNAALQLAYCRITAPFTGQIGLRAVDEGNMIHASDASGVAVITTLQPITVLFTIRQDDVPQLLKRVAAGPAVAVEAYDRDLKRRLATGILLAVDNQIDPGSGTVRIKASFPNDDGALFPNQFVNARLLLDTLRGVVLVPTAAVQRAPDKTFAYVVTADDTVEVRPLTVGPTEGEQTTVTGVEADETVVVDGVDKLTDGAKVSARRRNRENAEGKDAAAASTGGDGVGGGGGGKKRPRTKDGGEAKTDGGDGAGNDGAGRDGAGRKGEHGGKDKGKDQGAVP